MDGNVAAAAADVPVRYCAFISYNHRDRRHASWLHRVLETYRVPKRLQGRPGAMGVIGRRLRRTPQAAWMALAMAAGAPIRPGSAGRMQSSPNCTTNSLPKIKRSSSQTRTSAARQLATAPVFRHLSSSPERRSPRAHVLNPAVPGRRYSYTRLRPIPKRTRRSNSRANPCKGA